MEEFKQEVRRWVTKYKSNDGHVFDTKEQCLDYEARMNGTRRTCTNCNGRGRISEGFHEVRNELTCQYETVEYSHTCEVCGGKGYLDKKEVWE